MVDKINLPSSLFKYKTLNNETHVEDLIINDMVYFSKNSEFNDPFDLDPYFKTHSDHVAMRSYLSEQLYADPSLINEERQIRLNSLMDNIPELEETFSEVFKEKASDVGILCLTKNRNDIMMWSHYGDSHRGVCFEFNFGDIQTKEFDFQQVRYRKFKPVIDMVEYSTLDPKKMFDDVALTKNYMWRSENEYRSFILKSNIVKLPKNVLTSITLGCKISEENKDWVIRTNNDREHPLPILQSHMRKDRYQIFTTPI